MTTDRLYEFLILSKTLNYSKAAESLFISQSALSKHIRELEKELGLTLFERDNHSVSLTPAGLLLSREAYGLIDKCRSTENLLRLDNVSTRGVLRIAVSLEFSYASHIRIFTSQFIQRYPDIDVRLDVTTHSILPAIFDSCDILFAPCEFMNLPSGIHRKLVKSHTTYVTVPHGHEFLTKSTIKLSELAGQTLIVPFADELFGPYAQNLTLASRLTHDRLAHIAVPNLPTALTEIAMGRGIAILPRYAQRFSDDLFFIAVDNTSCHFNEFIYWDSREENGAAKLFYEEFCDTYIRRLAAIE